MQQQENEAMHKIANAESDEETSVRFKGLINIIRSKTFNNSNERINETIERLSESEREKEDNQEENEDDSGEDVEIEKISQNISDHVKFSMSELEGKKKRKKNDFE